MGTHRQRVAAAIACVVLVIAGTSAPAGATGRGWQVDYKIDPTATLPGSDFSAISAISATDAWAVGSQEVLSNFGETSVALVRHWDGTSWTAEPTPPIPTRAVQPSLSLVSAVNASDVWALGAALHAPTLAPGSFVSHWDGTQWRTKNLGENWVARNLAVISQRNVWVLGISGFFSTQTPAYAHWDGTGWTFGELPASPSSDDEGASVSANWAPAQDPTTGTRELLHFTGSAWSVVPGPPVTLLGDATSWSLNDVVDLGAAGVWATVAFAGDDGLAPGLELWQWDGTSWHLELTMPNESPFGMTTDNSGGLWILSAGLRVTPDLIHYAGGNVVAEVAAPRRASGPLEVNAILSRPGTSSVWAVGEYVSVDGSKTTGAIATLSP